MRLDSYLVENGYFESRNRSLEAIKSGRVLVDGKVAKPSLKYSDKMKLEIADEKFYASRAARKLEAFLEAYPISLEGKRALDIGSSTGGFAQILLEKGVDTLACVDVGSDQMHHSLKYDRRLSLYENTDIRDFSSPNPFELITCDVSFISILQITQDIDRLGKVGSDIVILYKPQFEVGKDVKRDSKGVVVDIDAISTKKKLFEKEASSLGWRLIRQAPSQIAGKDGNLEHLYYFIKQDKE